jgi:hypothetical protein
MRKVLPLLGGLLIGWLTITAVELASTRAFPLPAGVDPMNIEQMRAYAPNIPVGAFLLILGGWLLGSFTGSWLASRMARSRRSGHIVGGVLMAAGVVNFFFIPHPLWVMVGAIVAFGAGTFFGSKTGAAA